MLWSEEWRALGRWAERLTWWQKLLILPPAIPIAMVVAGACLCPLAIAFSAVVLIAVYGTLARSGHFHIPWSDIGLRAMLAYAYFVAFCFLGQLGEEINLRFKRWRSSGRSGDDPDESRA